MSFLVKGTLIEIAIFPWKAALPKANERQLKWGVQNGPITKNGVLSFATLFYWKFNLSIITLVNICFKILTTQMFIFIFFLSV